MFDLVFQEDQHFYIRLLNLRTGNRNEYLCGKGDISDDAYITTADIHNEPAPSYSMTLDDEIENTAPPRYSVTAREILSALKSNKNLRRPSWFNYDESSSEHSDDDVFLDALSQIGTDDDNEDNDEVFQESENSNEIQVMEMKTVKKAVTSEEISSGFISSCSDPTSSLNLNWNNKSKSIGRRSVEFSSECPTSSRSDPYVGISSDEDDDFECYQKKKRMKPISEQSCLRLICPSMATVMILDDDHHGIFSLTERSVCLTETVGTHHMLIIRCGGSRGKVTLSYRTEEGTAKPNRDYQHCQGEITFEEGETE